MVSGPDTSMLPSRRIAGLSLAIEYSFLLERDERRRSAGENGASDLKVRKKSERHFRSVASLGSSLSGR